MIREIEEFFASEGIEFYGVLPIEECYIKKERLLCGKGEFSPKSAICFLAPYYTAEGKNISKYAVSRDYHLYMRNLTEKLTEHLKKLCPDSSSYGFSDHSPINELYAAAKCGLGVIGDNGLLINEKYSSFVFIGEVFTDVLPSELGYNGVNEIKHCLKCGKCKNACPTGALSDYNNACLSDITQKKGELSPEQLMLMIENNTVWGCDICQDVCPYTERAKKNNTITTPIRFFHCDTLDELTLATLDEMDDETFSLRAYSWRKRDTIRRNLVLTEKRSVRNGKSKDFEKE